MTYASKPPVKPTWANSGDKITPTDAELNVGWPLTSTPPARQRFNWFFNLAHNGLNYFLQRGIPEWDSEQTYPIGAKVIASNGLTYSSLTENTNQDPVTNADDWEQWGLTLSSLSNLFAKVADLASTALGKGAAMIGFKQYGAGAIASTVLAKLQQYPTTSDYGCVGDGVADDTAAMQAFLTAVAGRIGVVMPGTFICTTLTISSGTTLIGHGANSSIIKAKNTLAGNAVLLKNAVQTGAVNSYSDRDIRIEGVQFNGNGLGTRVSELISFGKARRITLRDCRVTNVGYIGLGFGGCRGVRILNTEVDATGNPVVTAEGGPGIWFGNAGDGSHCIDVLVQGCDIHDTEWAGIYASADRCRIIGNDITSVKEAGIFSGFYVGLIIKGNNIDGVTKKNISASGIETGAAYVEIEGNVIKNVANCCIALTDTQNVNIVGNSLDECRQDSVSYPQGSMIGIVTQSASPNQPRWITVVGNTAISVGSQPYSFLTIGGSGSAAIEVLVEGNNCGGITFSSGKAFQVTGKWGSNCEHRNNLGADDFARGTTAVVTTAISPATSTATVLNFDSAPVNSDGMWVVGAPSRITIPENVTRVRLTGQVTFNGHASGIRKVSILKNGGAGYAGHAEAIVPTAGAAYSQAVNVSTGVINVVAGDYFELQCLQDTGGALALTVGQHFTWLTLEVL